MQDLLVANVERIDPTSEEAYVTLNSESGQVVAFSFPCDCNEGSYVGNFLYADLITQPQSPYFEDWPADERELAARERLDRTAPRSCSGCGRVIDPANGLVQACGFVIDVGMVPEGAEFVEFEVAQFSL